MSPRPNDVLNLLTAWESLSDQAATARRYLREHEAEVRGVLREIDERLQTGRWHTSGWNVFDVLGRVWLEDAHSDMVAWLLMPWEAHGLGDRFLRDFVLVGTGRVLPNSRVREVQTRKQIGCARKKIDIEVRGDGWILAIENKIGHVETDGQTECYATHYSCEQNLGVQVFAVFLTKDGKSARSPMFHPMSYRRLRRILEGCRARNGFGAAQLVGWFADHIRADLEVDI